MAEKRKYLNYINGEWKEPGTGDFYENFNPADNQESLGLYPLSDVEDVKAAIGSAEKAFSEWKNLSPAARSVYMSRFLEVMAEDRDRIGEAVCREAGKILKEALAEPDRGIEEVGYFIGEGQRLEGITMPSSRPGVSSVAVRVPLGVVATITPWNFPFLTPLRKVIPALVTGNTVVLKPASATPLSGVIIAELFEKAGLPSGVFNLVLGSGKVVGDAIASDPRVKGISFTGSTAVGRGINTQAAANFTKIQLEMGGKNPAIVADCLNLENAAAQITSSAFALSGQRCTSISRVIVMEKDADRLEALIAEKMKNYKLGNGLDPDVSLGPIISRSAGEKIMDYISGAVDAGAEIKAGGRQLKGGIFDRGFYIEPTLLSNVSPDMAAAREEIFGPVLVTIRVNSFDEAMKIANDTEYGLSASLFSDSLSHIDKFQREMETGMTHTNHGTVTDGTMPFGGVKNSGLGPFSKGKTNRDFFTNFRVNYVKYI